MLVLGTFILVVSFDGFREENHGKWDTVMHFRNKETEAEKY